MRFIFSFIILMQSWAVLAQNNSSTSKDDLQIIRNFVNDMVNEDIKTDVILSQYIIVENPNDELYDYLQVSLDEVRINLWSKKINDIRYTAYANMPRKDVRDIDIENIDPNRVYFLHYRNRQVLAVYLEHDKIASFTLVSKGDNKAHFVLY